MEELIVESIDTPVVTVESHSKLQVKGFDRYQVRARSGTDKGLRVCENMRWMRITGPKQGKMGNPSQTTHTSHISRVSNP